MADVQINLPWRWGPRDYQRPAWDYLFNGGRHAELVWHRRSGKDEICLHHTACAAMRRVGNYWHMLPEASQARKAIWDAINPHTGRRRVDEAFPRFLRSKTLNNEMMIEFHNGSTWQVVGSDNFDSLVGAPPVGVVYSEWALANPMARAMLRPIFAENNGWQVFIGTPRGRNHAHRTFRAAQADQRAGRDCFAQLLRAADTGILSRERLDEELAAYISDFGQDMGEALFVQEYECSFDSAILGAVLGREIARAEADGRITDEVQYDPDGAPLEITSDIGFHDTAAWWYWQPVLGGFHLIEYEGGSGRDADDWIAALQEKAAAKGYKIGTIWLPHDARARTFQSKHSSVERFLTAFPGQVRIVPQSRITDRINAARRVIRRCAFAETACELGIDALRTWQFEFNKETRTFSREPRHDWASHPGDSFSYGAQVLAETLPPERDAGFDLYNPPPLTIQDFIDEHEMMVANRRDRI